MEIVSTNQAPAAIGPYSQAIVVDGWVFTSGQIPLDLSGAVVPGGVVAQTERVFDNLQAVLDRAGSGLGRVVKATVFLSDMVNFPAVNEVYARRFGAHAPARSTVEVSRLPRDVLVEIELVARQL